MSCEVIQDRCYYVNTIVVLTRISISAVSTAKTVSSDYPHAGLWVDVKRRTFGPLEDATNENPHCAVCGALAGLNSVI